MEAIGKAKKEKWESEAQIKRLKIIQAKKNRTLSAQAAIEESTNASNVQDNDQDDKDQDAMSEVSEMSETPQKKKATRSSKKAKKGGSKKNNEPEEDTEETNMSVETTNHANHVSESFAENAEDEKLSPEELQKKIDKAARKLIKKRDELAFISNRVRVHDLGQDRYRRRYHHFAYAGGVYVESVESCEPWKLETQGLPHFDEDDRDEVVEKNSQEDKGQDQDLDHDKPEDQDDEQEMEIDDNEENIQVNGDNLDKNVKKEEPMMLEEDSKDETKEALAKLSSEILVTAKLQESKMDLKFMPKTTPNGEKLNMFNHTSNLNMTLSPIILNGAVTITPKDQMHHQHNFASNNNEKPWFSILPIGNPIDHQAKLLDCKTDLFEDNITPQINALEAKLEELRSQDFEKERHPIPDNLCRGWWRLSSIQDVNNLENSLSTRGTREQHLLTIVKRNLDLLQDAAKKALPDHMTLEPPEGYEDLAKDAPDPDPKGHWSQEAALRVDKYILGNKFCFLVLSGTFRKVLFHFENIGRQDDFAKF